jgi:predicted DNA-binding transcriptional regulator AlpA
MTNNLPAIPPALVDVALVDAATIAAAGGFCVSTFLDAVRRGTAPQPVIRRPRCTRWRLVDVRAYLADLPNRQSLADSERVIAQASRASRAAADKRRAGS